VGLTVPGGSVVSLCLTKWDPEGAEDRPLRDGDEVLAAVGGGAVVWVPVSAQQGATGGLLDMMIV
jgi:hypothetical protein